MSLKLNVWNVWKSWEIVFVLRCWRIFNDCVFWKSQKKLIKCITSINVVTTSLSSNIIWGQHIFILICCDLYTFNYNDLMWIYYHYYIWYKFLYCWLFKQKSETNGSLVELRQMTHFSSSYFIWCSTSSNPFWSSITCHRLWLNFQVGIRLSQFHPINRKLIIFNESGIKERC